MENEIDTNAILTRDISELSDAIDEYGYMDDDSDILDEGLKINVKKNDMPKVTTTIISKLIDFSQKEIKDEIKDKGNGKSVSDYEIPDKDRHLTINQMRQYIISNGDSDAKDSIRDKVSSLNKMIDKAKVSDKTDFQIGYGTINSIYSLYKRVRNATEKKNGTLTEAVTFIDNAGNVKTMSAEDYNKDMHEYNTSTQIPDYRKKKKIEYKLITEEDTVENILGS